MPGNGSIGGTGSCKIDLHFHDKHRQTNTGPNHFTHIDPDKTDFSITFTFPTGDKVEVPRMNGKTINFEWHPVNVTKEEIIFTRVSEEALQTK